MKGFRNQAEIHGGIYGRAHSNSPVFVYFPIVHYLFHYFVTAGFLTGHLAFERGLSQEAGRRRKKEEGRLPPPPLAVQHVALRACPARRPRGTAPSAGYFVHYR